MIWHDHVQRQFHSKEMTRYLGPTSIDDFAENVEQGFAQNDFSKKALRSRRRASPHRLPVANSHMISAGRCGDAGAECLYA